MKLTSADCELKEVRKTTSALEIGTPFLVRKSKLRRFVFKSFMIDVLAMDASKVLGNQLR